MIGRGRVYSPSLRCSCFNPLQAGYFTDSLQTLKHVEETR